MSAAFCPVAAARSRPSTALASAAPQQQQQQQQQQQRARALTPTLLHRRRRRSSVRPVVAEAASSSSSAPKLTNKPAWAGDDPLSRFVNVLISIKPLYAAMKAGARVVLKNSAEKAGVPWESAERALARQPVAAELEALRAALANPRVVYPDYYTQPFHAYDEGNLCWLAAREIEAATASMAIRTFRNSADPGLRDPAAAQAKLREGIHSRIREYCRGGGESSGVGLGGGGQEEERSDSSSSSSSGCGPLFQDILDIGCSSGISTRYLAAEFAPARVTGLDLSPYFLALAELRERQRERSREGEGGSSTPSSSSSSSSSSSVSAAAAAQAALPTPAAAGPDPPGRQRIAYLHANMEATPLPPASFDLVSVNFVVHECRPFAIDALCREAARLLRPGGVLAVADNNPASETLQRLPPALFALMKSTEPWSDEYYCYDLEEGMRRAGLEGVVTEEADHRHRCVLGRKRK